MPRLELIAPAPDREADFTDMVREFVDADEQAYIREDVLINEGFAAYVAWLARGERGELEGLVPWSAYWAVDADTGALVGISSLRHELSPWLAQFGGHIGYRVRPSMRRGGLGAVLLRLTLDRARARGIERALVVCTPENLGSQGVLRRHGAVFDGEVLAEGHRLWRYWVSTAGGARPDLRGRRPLRGNARLRLLRRQAELGLGV